MNDRPAFWIIYLLIRIPHARLIAAWSSVQQTIIDDDVDQWRERLYCCVTQNIAYAVI